MHRILAFAMLSALVLAGCADLSDPQTPPEPSAGDDGRDSDDARDPAAGDRNATLEGMPEFCDGEDGCDFWDDMFHEYVVYDLDTVELDVVIVPPAGASTPDNIAASRQAVQAWSDGIEELGAPWLTEAFSMNISAVGIDVPGLEAVEDPEIVVVSSSAAFLVGIGLEPKQILLGCDDVGQDTLFAYPVHEHGDVKVMAYECDEIGFTCFALNVGGADPRSLYDLIAHEVGHCLGAGHVGDALDFRARYAPVSDIMSYQDDPEQVHCVSNLNVRTLEGVYAHLLGQPADTYLPAGSYYHMAPEDYMQVECENPAGMA